MYVCMYEILKNFIALKFERINFGLFPHKLTIFKNLKLSSKIIISLSFFNRQKDKMMFVHNKSLFRLIFIRSKCFTKF